MKVVIDSNRVMAALIKDGTTREILFNKNFDFVAPDYMAIEVKTHKNMIIEKIGVTENEFDVLLSLVFEHVAIISRNEYDEFIVKFENDIKDQNDVAYMAACAATKAEGIWTHDPHFIGQKRIKVFTNMDLLKLSGKNRLDDR